MMKMTNPFSMTNQSPWPVIVSMSLMSMMFMLVKTLHSNMYMSQLIFMLTLILISSFLWWKDIMRESTYQGNHYFQTMMLLKLSMILFILSEVLFFVSFFWAFFHSSITPNIELGLMWPPYGILTFNPMGMPLMNSIILISSGATITWSHHSFLNNNLNKAIMSIYTTIMLGMAFTLLQGMEYYNSEFTFSDSTYGSTFFLTTGFHGIHVMVGSMFLMNSMIMMIKLNNSSYHFISFDLSAWYWHFVDVVWLFLYSSIYWWGSI